MAEAEDLEEEQQMLTQEDEEEELREAFEIGHMLPFKSEDARRLFRNKYIVVVGDSIMRGVYKDLVCWLQTERLLLNTWEELTGKAEENFLNDRLVYCTTLNDGVRFIEVREFISEDRRHRIQYYFMTRAYNQRMEHILQEIANSESGPPDLILMNSCLWDISRYREASEEERLQNYGETLSCLLNRVRVLFQPERTMFLWFTAPPLASNQVNGRRFPFLVEGLDFGTDELRMIVVKANILASQVCIANGIDVLDLHYFLKSYIDERQKDGVHWSPLIHRHISNLIVAFIASTYSLKLPEHVAEKFQTLITRNQSREQLSWGEDNAASSSKDVAWSKPKGPGDKAKPTIDETLPSFLQKQDGESSSYLVKQLVDSVDGMSSDKIKEVMGNISPSPAGQSEAEREEGIPVCYQYTPEELDHIYGVKIPGSNQDQDKAKERKHTEEEPESSNEVRGETGSNPVQDKSHDGIELSHSTTTIEDSSSTPDMEL